MVKCTVASLLTMLLLALPSMAGAQPSVDRPSASIDESQKIPLTLGFANFAGDEVVPLVNEDSVALSPLFKRTLSYQAPQLPGAHVLFLYVHLGPDGTIGGTKAGVRRVVELTQAGIVIVASPNSGESIKATTDLPGPKSANLVFTLDRKGPAFPRFFRSLLELMRRGQDMLAAWVELAPQGPVPSAETNPELILLPEAGNLAFPK